jgi:sulfur carrier protein ThiS
MQVSVNYEAQLRMAAGLNSEALEVADQCNLLQLLQQVAAARGTNLADRLLTADGQLQPGILLFVNEQPIPAAAAATRTLDSNDVILLYPPISGG